MVKKLVRRPKTVFVLAGLVVFLAVGVLALAAGVNPANFYPQITRALGAEPAPAPAAERAPAVVVAQARPQRNPAGPARVPPVVNRLLNLGNSFDQCANGSPATGTCSWTNGNLNSSNSTIFEGMSTPQRLLITSGLVSGDNTLLVGFSYTQSSKHSYDGFDSWAQASAEALTFTGHAYDFGNGAGVVNKPSCVNYTGGDVTSCGLLTAANGGAGFFM
ncbi:MAG TPA: hypothetical protein VKG01_10195, partial [Thermoanaerobaculia bacterium]|nr:hypothetical protein [Thermoanaerobaculia bacterium]